MGTEEVPTVTISESAHANAISARFLPRDRESFFDAHRRTRRATWRMSLFCLLSVLVMGIGLALIIADIINSFSPLPAAFWQFSSDLAHLGLIAIGWLLQQKPADPQVLAVGLAAMILPGVLLTSGLWFGIKLM